MHRRCPARGPGRATLFPLLSAVLWGCLSPNPQLPLDLSVEPPDLRATDAAPGPPDLGPRRPWRTLSPTPEDSNLQGIHGTSETDYYLISSGAVIHRVMERSMVEWRAAGPACLR